MRQFILKALKGIYGDTSMLKRSKQWLRAKWYELFYETKEMQMEKAK